MKAQNAANNHNRYQTLENSSISQLQPNPQARQYDADIVNDYIAGSQAYYFKGVPVTTVVSPEIFPPIAPITPINILPPPPINAINEFINTQNTQGIQAYIDTYGTAISLIEFRSSLKNGYTDSQRGSTLSVVLSYSNNGTTTLIPYTSPTYIQDFISTFDSVNTDNPPDPNLPIYAVIPIYTTSGSPYTATIDLTAPVYNGQSYASIIQNNIATLVFEIPISVTGALYELTLTYTMGSFITLRYNGTTLIDQNGTNYTANNSLTVGTLSIPLIGLGSFGGNANGGGTPLPVPILPGPPTITGLIPGNETLLVNYNEGTTGSNPIINYAYSINGLVGPFSPFDPPQIGSILTIIGLTNGTPYDIAIKAVSQDGSGESSNVVEGTPAAVLPGPPTITGLIPGNQTLLVNYDEGTTGTNPIINYAYSLSGSSGTFTPFDPPQIGSILTITGLTNNTTYIIAIKAVSQDGSGESSNDVSSIPLANPPPPQILSVISSNPVGPSLGQLTVYFSQSPYSPSPTNYQYTTNGSVYNLFSVPQTNSPVIIENLTINTLYSVGLRAYVSSSSISIPSNIVSVSPVTSSSTIQSFFGSTTWTAPLGIVSTDVLVVGGGGGGGGAYNVAGGGGGGGGYVIESLNVSVNPETEYTITVGAGGIGGVGQTVIDSQFINQPGLSGEASSFQNIIASGGGGGKESRVVGGPTGGTRATGSTPSTGGGGGAEGQAGGGGGGNSGNGQNGGASFAGLGGGGVTKNITQQSISYGIGGNGGGKFITSNGVPGNPGTGNGGGGISAGINGPNPAFRGGTGGSGIIVLKY